LGKAGKIGKAGKAGKEGVMCVATLKLLLDILSMSPSIILSLGSEIGKAGVAGAHLRRSNRYNF
jgi:hypothetical protein